MRAVGVRYHVAPSNRSARACSTPAVSAPASGCPPTNRGSSTAATTERLVEPTSVTTQSVARRGQHLARPSSGSAPTGAATNATSAPSTRLGDRAARRRRPRRARARAGEHAVARVEAAHARAEPLARGEPDRAADQAHADHGHHGPARTGRHQTALTRALCRRPPRRARPARRTRRTDRRTAAAGRRRSPPRGAGAPRR